MERNSGSSKVPKKVGNCTANRPDGETNGFGRSLPKAKKGRGGGGVKVLFAKCRNP